MAKSTNSSNLFSGFNPPKIEKKTHEVTEPEKIKEEVVEEPKPIDEKDIDAIVQQRVEQIIEAKKASETKIGRPKKYMSASKVISVRIDSETYAFVRNKGRTEFDGITDYINHLIKKEMC